MEASPRSTPSSCTLLAPCPLGPGWYSPAPPRCSRTTPTRRPRTSPASLTLAQADGDLPATEKGSLHGQMLARAWTTHGVAAGHADGHRQALETVTRTLRTPPWVYGSSPRRRPVTAGCGWPVFPLPSTRQMGSARRQPNAPVPATSSWGVRTPPVPPRGCSVGTEL